MKLLIKFLLIALPTLFLLSNCTIETDGDSDNENTEISNSPVTGSLAAGESFTLNSALVEQGTLFGDAGYDFKLFSTSQTCVQGFIPNVPREIDFFVTTDSPLETRVYDGLGPFIRNSSFFGCTIEITAVSDSSISGKVKGGDPIGDQWVEGSFTATLCN